MEKRSFVTIADLSKEKILYMLDMAKEFEKNTNRKILDGKIVATLFFEPSTRTRLSFETAANRLGAKVIGFTDPKVTSSSKGETLKGGFQDSFYLVTIEHAVKQAWFAVLIEDIFAGIFIVFEHTFEIGDIIVVDGFRGTVKEMGIRSTKIEDAGGDVKVINNSDIRTLINMTSKLSTAICDISISYSADIEKVEKVIANNLPAIKKRHKSIVNGPTYVGVQSLSDSAVILRVIAECNETMRYQVQRDINRELKLIFDKNRISIPFPQIVVHQAEKEGE